MYIKRDQVSNLVKLSSVEQIKVITGVRRCGKSTLLTLLFNELKDSYNISTIDFEDYDNIELTDPKKLHKYMQSKIKNGCNMFLIDEIQMVNDFQRVLASINKLDVQIYVTGSNAKMLSGELATLLSGRYIEIKAYPFTFLEFCQFQNLECDNKILNIYLQDGGMPTLQSSDDEIYKQALNSLVDTIILNDIVMYNKNIQIPLLKKVFAFICINSGHEISIAQIVNYLNNHGENTNHRKISEIIEAMELAYLIKSCGKFFISGKEVMSTIKKYYVIDNSFTNFVIQKQQNIGMRLETLIFNYLVQLGYEVTSGTVDKRNLEVDFIARHKQSACYIQVAYTISEEKTLAREVNSLSKIKDSFPKYLITMDETEITLDHGIIHIPAIELLSNNNKLLS